MAWSPLHGSQGLSQALPVSGSPRQYGSGGGSAHADLGAALSPRGFPAVPCVK